MKTIKTSKIKEITKRLLVEASFFLPKDIIEALGKARKTEDNSLARYMLDLILENADIASSEKLPLCQDCGTVYIDIDVGRDICIYPDIKKADKKAKSRDKSPEDHKSLTSVLNDAVKDVYINYYLRKSIVCDPLFARINTATNTPAIIDIEYPDSTGLDIEVNLKGGGSENCSWLFMLNPSNTAGDIIRIVTGLVIKNVTKACPPVIIGIGLGSGASGATKLARKAAFRNLDIRNNNQEYANLESIILKKANDSGIGPSGVGGRTTALACNIETAPCHMATLPMAVYFGCHSTRRKNIHI